jgi:hypothetical protein
MVSKLTYTGDLGVLFRGDFMIILEISIHPSSLAMSSGVLPFYNNIISDETDV